MFKVKNEKLEKKKEYYSWSINKSIEIFFFSKFFLWNLLIDCTERNILAGTMDILWIFFDPRCVVRWHSRGDENNENGGGLPCGKGSFSKFITSSYPEGHPLKKGKLEWTLSGMKGARSQGSDKGLLGLYWGVGGTWLRPNSNRTLRLSFLPFSIVSVRPWKREKNQFFHIKNPEGPKIASERFFFFFSLKKKSLLTLISFPEVDRASEKFQNEREKKILKKQKNRVIFTLKCFLS